MYRPDQYILDHLNKYIMMDDKEAKQKEDLMIGLIQKYQHESEHTTFFDTTIIKYLLLYLRQLKKELYSNNWILVIRGSYISFHFIQFLKDNNVWSDYTAQLLCISNKDNIKCDGDYFSVINNPKEWFDTIVFKNKEYFKASEKYNPKSPYDLIMTYEWENIKGTPEWNAVDITQYETARNLTGIPLMKCIDYVIDEDYFIKKIVGYDWYDEFPRIEKECYEIGIDETNRCVIRTSHNPLLLKAKQYISVYLHNPFYDCYDIYKEEYDPYSPFKLLTPTDLKVITISKEYNIKKLVIETKEGHTIHTLYDFLPKALLTKANKYKANNEEQEKVLRELVLANYKVCVEFDKFTNTILRIPFLVDNKCATSYPEMCSSKERDRYYLNYFDLANIEDPICFVYKIDEISYNKTNKLSQLTMILDEDDIKELRSWWEDNDIPIFGKFQITDNSLILTIKDLLLALTYNVIAKSDGTNNIFELLKENNYLRLDLCDRDDSIYYDIKLIDDEHDGCLMALSFQQMLF